MAKGFGGALKSFKSLKKMWRDSKVGGKMIELPDGIYQAKLLEAVLTATKEKKLPNIKFVLEIMGGDYDGQKISVNHVLILDNEEQLAMKLSSLKTTLSIWFPDEKLDELGELLFEHLEQSRTGNDTVWTSAEFEKVLEQLKDSEVEFKVVNKKKDDKKYMNVYLNNLISAPGLDLEESEGKDAADSKADADEEEDEEFDEDELEELDDEDDDDKK